MLNQSAETWRSEQREREFVESLKAQAPIRYEFFVGVDIGKLQDRSAIAVIERQTRKSPLGDETQTALRFLATIKPQTSYVAQADGLERLLTAPCFELWGASILLDSGGVGEAVGDLLFERGKVRLKRVMITSGDAITAKRGRIYCSRNQLIATLAKLLRREEFIISADLPLLGDLLNELSALGEESSKSGATVYRTSEHDDLTIAFALAALALARKDSGLRTGVRPLF